ncbi:hypothetical protein [Streptomyces sp. NPDC004266]|uniref:hypothetical protein n=1 Tax=Streptomyces sp. NPDC004266 TaxID=3364693 RepID=UPI0036956FED
MSSWMIPEGRNALVRLVLLELFEQVMDDSYGTRAVPPQEGGRPSCRPPAGGHGAITRKQRNLLSELACLLRRNRQGTPLRPAEQRRVAELFELFEAQTLAVLWWKKAAESGDEDAKAYLEVLGEEKDLLNFQCDARKQDPLAELSSALKEVLEMLERVETPRSLDLVCRVREISHCVVESGVPDRVDKKELDRLIREVEEHLANQVANGGRLI